MDVSRIAQAGSKRPRALQPVCGRQAPPFLDLERSKDGFLIEWRRWFEHGAC
jgi:hypothetical protein